MVLIVSRRVGGFLGFVKTAPMRDGAVGSSFFSGFMQKDKRQRKDRWFKSNSRNKIVRIQIE